jgi:hypothetical protein
LAFGSEARFGAGSGGFVVAALNAASAACSGSLVLRGLSKAIDLLLDNWRFEPNGVLNLRELYHGTRKFKRLR